MSIARCFAPPLLALLLVAPACAPAGDDPVAAGESDVTGTAVASKDDLFEGEIYYARVTGWDPSRMTPESVRDEQHTEGAELALFKAKKDSTVHCPDADATDAALVYKTQKFALRTSGNFTNGTPKSSYKLKLEAKDDRLFDMKALNFKSMWNDVSQMREALAWRLFAKAGVRAPRHTYAKLCINGRYYGLYSMIEEVDKAFLEDRFEKNKHGNLYKAYWENGDVGPATLGYRTKDGDDSGRQYFRVDDFDARTYQLKTNDDEEDAPLQTYDDLATFTRVLNGHTVQGDGAARFASPGWAAAMEKIFDVKGFLRWASVNALLGAWDNYWATPANYYIYNAGPRAAPKEFMTTLYFTWIPWDYDNSFGSSFDDRRWQLASIVDWRSSAGGSAQPLPLLDNLLANEGFLRYYLDAIEWMNDTYFTDAWVTEQIGDDTHGLWSRVKNAAFLESDTPDGAPHTGRQFTNHEIHEHAWEHEQLDRNGLHLEGIVHYFRMRHDNVKSQLARLRTDHPRGSSGATFPAAPSPIP